MAQRSVEWYSLHTNGVALRRIVLQNIRRSSSILNCLALHALIGLPNIVFAIKAFRYHFDWKMSQQIKNISFDIFQSKWYRNALIGVPKVVFAIKAFRYHFDWKMSQQIKNVSFLTMAANSAHKGTHKIQLLTYSWNIERAVEVKLSLKRKRESEKRKELYKRHLMHVII